LLLLQKFLCVDTLLLFANNLQPKEERERERERMLKKLNFPHSSVFNKQGPAL
jgi:hypothetical protein